MTNPISLINQHIPSLSEGNETQIWDNLRALLCFHDDNDADVANLAIRTCSCGLHIDGFYEYADHLKDVFDEAIT